MKLDWLVYRILGKLSQARGGEGRVSYSQCGEDMIVRYIFDMLHVPAPSYLDIGAHHPSHLNNTLIFYQSGSHGVNIEPDPLLLADFHKVRPRDINLNIGIAEEKGELDFYVMSSRTLNTFSARDAQSAVNEGKTRIESVIKVPVVSVNEVLRDNFSDITLDFVSLDVEGLDLMILQSFDFSRWRPKVICVETITYSEHHKGKKIREIDEVLVDNGYFPYADTYINTIYVDRGVW